MLWLLNRYRAGLVFEVGYSLFDTSQPSIFSDTSNSERALEFCFDSDAKDHGLPNFGNVLGAFFDYIEDDDFEGYIIRNIFDNRGIAVPSEIPNSWYGANFKFVNHSNGCIKIEHSNNNQSSPNCRKTFYEDKIKNKDIVFTKKYGWVDLNHAFTDTNRNNPFIGAKNLWNQLKNPPSANQIFNGYYSVNYKQDVVRGGLSIGVERQYLIKPGLNLDQRKSVALAIFQDVSIAFESLQSLHPTSTSSFSPEDLPSNMLGFYRHVEGLTKDQILNTIEPVDVEKSLEVFRSYPCTFADKKFKNKSFNPIRFESPYTSSNFGVPDILNTIKPFEIKSLKAFGKADLIFLEQDIISK